MKPDLSPTIYYLLSPEFDQRPAHRPRLAMAKAFGELRSVLSQSLPATLWANVVTFLQNHRFTADTRLALVNYLPSFLATAPERYALEGPVFRFARPSPASWYELTRRTFKTHFGFEFADAVSFSHTTASQRDAILSSPSLRNIRTLYMGASWSDKDALANWHTQYLDNLERFGSPMLADTRLLSEILNVPTVEHLYMPFSALDLQMQLSHILETLTQPSAAKIRSLHLNLPEPRPLNDAFFELALGLPYLEELYLLKGAMPLDRTLLEDVLSLRESSPEYAHLPPLALYCITQGPHDGPSLISRFSCLSPKSKIIVQNF